MKGKFKNPMKKLLTSTLFVLMLFITNCGGQIVPRLPRDGGGPFPTPTPVPTPMPAPITLTAADVFSPSLNQVWTFQDGYGNQLYITQQAAVPSDYLPANAINFVYQKNACGAYWAEGVCDALLHFVLVQQPDGSWTSPASLFDFPTQIPDYMNGHRQQTSNFLQVPGEPVPYTIIPASATTGVITSVPTQYDRYDAPDVYTFDSVVSGSPAERVNWTTTSYIENVTTPVYSGPALVSEQFESACIHEKWYFAPGHIGLVKIVPLDNGSCVAGDLKLTMVRIN